MKNSTLKHLLVSLAIMLSGLINAQVTVTNETSNGACDGEADLINSSTYSSWTWLSDSTTLQTGGDSITGLCAGTYILNYTDSTGSNSYTFTVGTDSTGSCSSLMATISSVNTTADSLCDGSASVTVTGGTPAYSFMWSDSSTTSQLTNLCSGTYVVTVTDANGCSITATTFVGADSTANPCNGFYASTSSVDISADSLCDGSASVTVTGGTPAYTYAWNNGGNAPQIVNLCAGNYTVTITDGSGCSTTATAYVFTDSSTANTNPILGYVQTVDESASGTCDGTADVTAIGGTPPYVYTHSNGATTALATNLCAGPHTVVITDAMGDSTVITYLVSTPGNTVNNPTYQDSTINDTIISEVIENCTINYSSVDSVQIDSYNFFDANTVTVVWAVYYPGNTVYITETYNLTGGNGVYSLELSLICPEKATGQFLKATDQIYYHSGMVNTGITENEDPLNISVYPNPFTTNVTVEIEKTGTYAVRLYDIRGKLILQENHVATNQIQLNLNNLSQGQYILTIQNETHLVTKKLVK